MRLRTDLKPVDWDAALARLGGHPLQSSAWGQVRLTNDGIESRYWCLSGEQGPIWLARIETRPLPGIGRIAWIPRGPTGALPAAQQLPWRDAGFDLVVTDHWQEATDGDHAGRPRTIWLDLTRGETALWGDLHTQLRNRVRTARRSGVEIRVASSRADFDEFVTICRGLEKSKGFDARISSPMVEALAAYRDDGGAVDGALVLACSGGRVAAGTFVLRTGRNMSMLWAGADRSHSRERAGEAAHWAAILWGLEHGCTRYDLEGIDPIRNPGVYRTKRNLGGREVTLAGKVVTPHSLLGRIIAPALRRYLGAP